MKNKTVAFQTLGCKLNFSESSTIARNFIDRGYSIVDFNDQADIYVVHTCTVTSVAEKKCRAAISQANRRNPEAKIAVIGCYAQLKPTELQNLPGVDIVLGNQSKFNLAEYLESPLSEGNTPISTPCKDCTDDISDKNSPFNPSWSAGDRTRSFLKVQDGCDHYCTYCAIPHARGRSRSGTIQQVVGNLNEIISSGIKEVILTGVNIGDFGKRNINGFKNETFTDLLKALNQVPKAPRIRMGSIEPELLTDELIQLTSDSDIIMPHFHLPLQSGSNPVLKAMRRKYDTQLYAERVFAIKNRLPHACIAADVITGFPGETEENFEEMRSFIESLPISYLHIFTYSERPNTKALEITSKIASHEKQRRSKVLHELAERKAKDFFIENVGREESILWEAVRRKGLMEGFTSNYIRVKRVWNKDLINSITTNKIPDLNQEGEFILADDQK